MVGQVKLILWRLSARLPIPSYLALSKLAQVVERWLTNDYYLQRQALKYVEPEAKTLLDVGCGGAAYLDTWHGTKWGIDINPRRIVLARKHCIACLYDIRKGLPLFFTDSVLCLEVIEHLTKRDGHKLLKGLEHYRQVILSTPRYYFTVSRDSSERHLSYWSSQELERYGYRLVEECKVPPSNIYVREQ